MLQLLLLILQTEATYGSEKAAYASTDICYGVSHKLMFPLYSNQRLTLRIGA
jgi:hypothetical protein